ncbi:MAG: molybdenum cofactor biosynthesis protein MoaE [bacterium]
MIDVVREKIDIAKILQAVEDDSTGGVVFFVGRVRDHAGDHQVVRMEYEGYEKMAKAGLQKIADAVKHQWPVKKLAIVHRLGMLELGEASVVIAVACAHRSQAFAACQFAIDTLKKTIPIWKKEYGPDGASWVEGVVPGQ